ncbi:MAG: ribonuclease P [Candidatus Woesearchaeota archaeon]|jgi:ribonuclease P protein subunit RPR2|nr:ribonuclease P [Candidatus Woesearchaeota archaeon]MDP7457922.1 ribonuclease P [Candidatus Woesearchaeota archaeon]
MRSYKPTSPKKRELAFMQIEEYMAKAGDLISSNKALSRKYVQKARRVGMRYKVRFPKSLKRSFCKHCFSCFKPGINVTVRTNKGKVVYHCKECKGMMRYGYK